MAALAVFLATRLYGLERFPIYFFTDEAVQTVSAADFLHHGLRNSLGELLPTYFQNGAWLNLSVSVYAQVVPYLLFGYSEVATRGTSVLVALSGTAAVGLMLRDVFRVRFWWAGTLLLAATPTGFLHSRTAFETVPSRSTRGSCTSTPAPAPRVCATCILPFSSPRSPFTPIPPRRSASPRPSSGSRPRISVSTVATARSYCAAWCSSHSSACPTSASTRRTPARRRITSGRSAPTGRWTSGSERS